MTRSSQKQDFYELLSYTGESSAPKLQIAAGRPIGGFNVPRVGVAELSDHAIKEKFDRSLKSDSPSDTNDTFISHVQFYQSELCRSSTSSTPKDIGGCKISGDPHSTESGTDASKADAAFGEELSLIGSDKDESLQKIGLQIHRKVHKLHMRSQADEFSYKDKFSRCFTDIREQMLPFTSCRGAQSSNLCSQPQRKSSRLLSKRRRACLDWDLLEWEFEKVEDVVLLDDEDLCGETMDGPSDEWWVRIFLLLLQTMEFLTLQACTSSVEVLMNDPESVALSYSDMECLNPEQFLSSPVMNFYIQYLQRSAPTTCRPQSDYHIFNTFFFGKLEKALSQKGDRSQCFFKLRRWWKGVNIFSKAYILLPIHGSSHWSLVIICNPGKEDNSGTLILHLDSLGLHSSQQISRIISNFLKEEWNYMSQNPTADFPFRGHIWQHVPLRIDKKKVMVPQQKNEYDCGIFVLYFIKRFLEEAPQRLRKHDLSMFHAKWFKPAEASSLRTTIRDLLNEEFSKSMSPRVESSLCSNTWDVS
ncbi:hypothetical protein IEQ34_003674 [Dendrobium chrysotoxum]|uniref:Ubiquitin-like protease family profile domain-containing protein n=1 Tax=Dendrobium chrysotoxum TaxID=161865 RepID=A0AAV7HC06_DENCH|nr:hypothetical protein IEQ34_003674 [Dendrobium chrysotoxum]